MPEQLLESRPLAEAAPTVEPTGRMRVQLITPGWGASGYYSPQVLEAAAGSTVFPAGTHMYLDHPSTTESYERPERSVRDLAAVLTSDAIWDGSALVAEAQTFGPYREALVEMRDAIGVSIRASAEVEMGEAEGRRGRVVTELVEGISADFVTHAGRGGRILEVLESARPSRVVQRVVERGVAGVTEASARDMREQLSTLLTDAYGAEKTWTWVRDFDPDRNVVWYELETPDSSGVYEHSYTVADDGAMSLSGTPIEVRVQTSYVPVDPAGQATTTESQGGTMPQIEEAEHRRLVEAAGRVTTLESERTTLIAERDTAVTERDEARRELAESNARNAARPIVAAVLAESTTLPAAVQARVAGEVVDAATVNESGQLDETALRTAAEAARTAAETEIATVLEAHGVGKPRNLGGTSTPSGAVTESDIDKARAAAFGRTVKES